MKFIFEPEESESIFYNALCNGLSDFNSHGIQLNYIPDEYKAARELLKASLGENAEVCYEDVLMQILRSGGSLKVIDIEGEGDQDAEITLKDVHERMAEVSFKDLSDMLTENDDAYTADNILQTIFYEEIIYS